MNIMPNKLKELVSKNKIRYQADGFDLDLAYINKNIIAMGFPAENLEGVYRNHLEDVQRFLETKHENRYKIYNLCLEREYLPTKFKGTVTKYPFKDHNPPPLTMMMMFCKDVHAWLSQDVKNVAVIHCKAGKGRTGVMICAYLIYSERISADQALSFYAKQRTKDSKGVTIPSQRRYVQYFWQVCMDNHHHHQYSSTPLKLVAFKFNHVPNFTSGHHYNMYFTIQDDSMSEKFEVLESIKKGDSNVLVEVNQACRGDVKIDVGCRSIMGKESMFHFWFNTFFVRSSEITDLSQLHRIPSRRSHEVSSSNPASGAINVQNNNVSQRSSFRSSGNSGSVYSSSFSYADFGNRHNSGQALAEWKKALRPEFKKELITRALLFMQKGHRSHHLGDEVSNHDQVLTSFRVRDQSAGNDFGQDGNILGGKRSPSSPRLFLRHNRNNVNNDVPVARCQTIHDNTFKTLVLTKYELDKANKDKQHKIFPHDFTLTLYFISCPSDSLDQTPFNHNKESDDDDDDVSDDDDDDCKIIV